jgi:hypothetical protein
MSDQTKTSADYTSKDQNQRGGMTGGHAVATGVGAVGVGAAAGAAGGAIAGPIGAVAGAAAGAVVGGLAGKAAGQAINPVTETKHWKDTYPSRPYANTAFGYDEYAPAYRYGWESFDRSEDENGTFEDAENDMSRGWDKAKGASKLKWEQAKDASRDAWNRVSHAGRNAVRRDS